MNDESKQSRSSAFFNSMLEIAGVILLFTVGSWGYNHFFNKPDVWSLMYENNLGMVVRAGDYSTREECAQKLQIARSNPSMYYRPECGSNCKAPETLNGPYVCERTFEI